ncbi:CoA-binding protein [Falsihalocynthiibacter sp. S25ZX9]|uniref:CoA-binding protein n=1 Tax=unclassified Falsihalocynthiibacter TaxID=2854191 RepID=UPI0035105AD7
MKHTDQTLREIFTDTRVIACVGMSKKPERASYYVSEFLKDKGFRIIPVNPVYVGQTLLGEPVRTSLTAIEADIQVDMIDIFRRSEDVLPVVEEALARFPNLKVIWMQLGIENAQAAELAEARGVTVIQNRCPKIEYPRLFG